MNRATGPLQVSITQTAYHLLVADIYQRRAIEACGVLIGTRETEYNWRVEHVQPLNNTAHSATYFEFAPEELLEAELRYPEQIVGVYHSHPTGYAKASNTDRENMRRVNLEQNIPWVWLIVCGPFFSDAGEHGQKPEVLAYYHDKRAGLQTVSILLEEPPT